MSSNCYLDVSLELNTEKPFTVTATSFKQHVIQSLYILFGEVGSSVSVELLKYIQSEKRAVLSVPEDFYVKLYGALTLNGLFNGTECAYRVHRTTRNLIEIDPALSDPSLEDTE